MSQNSIDRNIDIVFCIDATSSMGPCIENVRKHAKTFHHELSRKLDASNSIVSELRVQVVAFRDLECDTYAIQKSEFFELPSDNVLFEKFLDGIHPMGGGDYKESGIEALYTAMTTDWKAKSEKDRQIILLFTDADAIGFDEKKHRTGYGEMVNEKMFYDTWYSNRGNYNTMIERNKRLVMFAPAGSIYDKVLNGALNMSQLSIVKPKNGMADIGFEAILEMLRASVSGS